MLIGGLGDCTGLDSAVYRVTFAKANPKYDCLLVENHIKTVILCLVPVRIRRHLVRNQTGVGCGVEPARRTEPFTNLTNLLGVHIYDGAII